MKQRGNLTNAIGPTETKEGGGNKRRDKQEEVRWIEGAKALQSKGKIQTEKQSKINRTG